VIALVFVSTGGSGEAQVAETDTQIGSVLRGPERELSGVIIAGGVVCPLLQTDSGEIYALSGAVPARPEPGTQLRLRGYEAKLSICQQGREFRVTQVVN